MDILVVYLIMVVICPLIVLTAQVNGDEYVPVNITILEAAVAGGAVCLDGSPPAYAYTQGYGSGSRNWVVYMQGGGWCTNISECQQKTKISFGSSHLMGPTFNFSGIFDLNQTFNSEFYNWHKVFMLYCDGSSFMSDIQEVDPATNLTFRGARIFNFVMYDLLAKGMTNATNALLVGGSAGGLATILHCDAFHSLIPNASRVKCLSDSGFFLHAKDLLGVELREKFFGGVVETHKLAKLLPTSCTSRMNPNLCLFAEYLVKDIQTPIFLLESTFDTYQIPYLLAPTLSVGAGWRDCMHNLTLCTLAELRAMKDFRTAFIETLHDLGPSSTRGMFVDSCFQHTHIFQRCGWMCSFLAGNDTLANKTIGQAFVDWYFDRHPFAEIDTQNDLPRYCSLISFTSNEFYEQCAHSLPKNV